MTTKVQFHPYCGLSMPEHVFETMREARDYVSRRIRAMRMDSPVAVLTRGKEWEFLEPDSAAMVPDFCGTLRLTVITHECRECGCEYEDAEDAARCCTVFEFMDDSEDTE